MSHFNGYLFTLCINMHHSKNQTSIIPYWSLANGAGIDEKNTSSILSKAIDQVSSTAAWWEISHFSLIIGVEFFSSYIITASFCSPTTLVRFARCLGYKRIQSDAKHPSPHWGPWPRPAWEIQCQNTVYVIEIQCDFRKPNFSWFDHYIC